MVNDVNIGGGATCVTFQGTGDNCRMYTYSEDYPTSNDGNILVRYDIGSAETWGQAPNQTYTWFSKSGAFTNTNTEALAIDNGVFVSQARGAGYNVKSCPGFAYMDNDGNVLFNSASIEDLTSCGTGIAITKDLKTFAVSDPANAGISFFSVAWDGNTPSMTKLYSVKATAAASEHCQMTFDRAGNLHVFARGYGYQMFSVVNPAPVATTPARKALVIKASASGVENVTTDREATLSVYPNPATDIVTVNAGDEIATLAVYSLTGAQMGVDAQVNGSTATLNVSGLQTGAYILSVNGKTTKLIKR
jgi:uncharacterized protein GlcG (DUF336 family)